ncbi:hypothetical protein FRB96_008447 [Tulasnella sp. 330]|nr:hypothetical protein FRB96_008447 [Tulasnella sp. 330]KAG8872305.1 hypothetical protein FRB97_007780 [Tulasnella sp. 331]
MASIEFAYRDKIDETDIIMSIYSSTLRNLRFKLSALALRGMAQVNEDPGQSLSRLKSLRIIGMPKTQLWKQVVWPLTKLQNLGILRIGDNPHTIGEISTGLVGTGAFLRLLKLHHQFLFDHTTAPILEEIGLDTLKILEMKSSDDSRITQMADLEAFTRAIALHVLLNNSHYTLFTPTLQPPMS